MHAPSPPAAARPVLTLAGCVLGARLTLPFVPAVVVFAAAYGAGAVAKGLTFAEALAMSALVYAGVSQLVALEQWGSGFTPLGIAALLVSTLAVNARMILQGATLQPWMRSLSPRAAYPSLFLLTDATWLVSARYEAEGGRDLGVFLGSGLFLWALWVGGTAPGYLAGALMAGRAGVGLELVMPVMFASMGVGLWKGRAETVAWSVAGAVALAVSLSVPGYWFIVGGALAGAGAAALLGEPCGAPCP